MKHGLLLLAIALAAHAPSLWCGFVWDDLRLAVDHPVMHRSDGVVRVWTSAAHPDYWPMTYTFFWMERRCFGLAPAPYHAVNLVLHAAIVVVLWRVLKAWSIPGAWWSAAIFAVHPVNVEAVAWIFQQKTLLSALFGVITLRVLQAALSNNSGVGFAISLFAFFLAMASKSAVAPLAVVIALVLGRKKGSASIFFLAVALALGGVSWWFQQHQAIAGTVIRTDHGLERVLDGVFCLGHYVRTFFWPADLCFVTARDVWHSAGSAFGLAGFIFLFVVGIHRRGNGDSTILMALGTYLLFLLPVLGVADIFFMRYSLVADHWQYLALPGLCVASVAAVDPIPWTWTKRLPLALATLFLAVLSWQRTGAFRSEESLWRDTLAKHSTCWMALDNLGGILLQQGKVDDALRMLREAERVAPHEAAPTMHLGTLFALQGDWRLAVEQYARALDKESIPARLHFWKGSAHERLGEWTLAERHYREETRIRPDLPATWIALGEFLARRGRYNEALESFQNALEIDPNDPVALDRFETARRLLQAGNAGVP